MTRRQHGRWWVTPNLHCNSCHRAFTLIEIVMSMAIMSVLFVAIGSTLVVASYAVPKQNDLNDRILQSSKVLQQLIDELQTAIHVTERTATAVNFTVADRNGDGLLERIRWAWSGTSGDPLTRQYNGNTVTNVAENLRHFSLTYTLTNKTEQYPGPENDVESAEVELSSHTTISGIENHENVKSNLWHGQHFVPVLPPEAISWKVTRVLVMARNSGSSGGEARVQLRTSTADNTPTNTVIEEQPMLESNLDTNYRWEQFTFNSTSGLAPGKGLCLVLQWISGDTPATIQHNEFGSGSIETVDAGATWGHEADEAMLHYVYGTYTTPGSTTIQTIDRQYVRSVDIALQCTDDVSSRLVTAAPLLNQPEVLSKVWEIDFNADPTTIDLRGDGIDWTLTAGSIIDGDITGGVWIPGSNITLKSRPGNMFTEPTTVDIRYRDTVNDGHDAISFRAKVDRTGDTFADIQARIALEADNTQTVTLKQKLPSNAKITLAQFTGLPNTFVHLREILDPEADTIAIIIDGQHRGTYGYTRHLDAGADAANRGVVKRHGTGAEVDYVRIRVGGTSGVMP